MSFTIALVFANSMILADKCKGELHLGQYPERTSVECQSVVQSPQPFTEIDDSRNLIKVKINGKLYRYCYEGTVDVYNNRTTQILYCLAEWGGAEAEGKGGG